MKKLAFLLMFCACNLQAQNLILNGSFEQNNITGVNCKEDLSNTSYNSLMQHSSALSVYGNIENGILFENCSTWTSVVPEGISYDGDFVVYLTVHDTIFNSIPYESYTALSLKLQQQLQIGAYYRLSYYQKIFPHIYPNNFIAGQVVVGVSDSATTFGITVDTMAYPTTNWTKIELTFQANIPAQHLTIKAALKQGYRGALVDHFVLEFDSAGTISWNCMNNNCVDTANSSGTYNSLASCQAVCGSSAIEENTKTKQLLKITDVLGRKSKPTPNVPLFYRYSDGTVEKRIIIE